ncbi:MAG: hypothetical protein OEL83_05355 [Desulforhopalus sp.]|nr:hypothetical protein [Desulforhopalus sp.]
MYIHNASAFVCDPVDDIAPLKAELKKYTDYFFRRVNKFIMLSLMGVHQCVHGRTIDPATAVYLSTENGNLGDTENVLHQIFRENSFPKPLNFINTMSNTASFYVAQSLQTLGRSITVSSKNVAFERGLELARVDFALQHIQEALIGGVDEALFSRKKFTEKYHASYHSVKLVEGSSWLYCTARKAGAIGEILDVATFRDREQALAWASSAASGHTVLAFGILMTPPDKELFRKQCGNHEELDYITRFGYYETSSAFAVGHFLKTSSKARLLHINCDTRGQYSCVACQRY